MTIDRTKVGKLFDKVINSFSHRSYLRREAHHEALTILRRDDSGKKVDPEVIRVKVKELEDRIYREKVREWKKQKRKSK